MAAPSRRLRSVPEAPSRAGLYVRVSDVHGRAGERFFSPDQQSDAMRGLCLRMGWEPVETWTDLDRSGRTFRRDGIQAALAAVEAGHVDVLVVYDCSRLGRNTGESIEAVKRIRAAGAVFASVAEQIDDTPSGTLALTLWFGLAQHLSDTMSVRWQDTHRRVFEQGRHHGPVPLGYRRVEGRPGEWEEDPVTAPAVREAFSRYASGATVLEVATYLARELGRRFHRDSVRAMLSKPTYRGLVHLNGQTRPGRHPALVDERTWARVQRQLGSAARSPKRRIATSWSMSGVAVCDLCGQRLSKQQVKDARRSEVYLMCRPRVVEPDPVRCSGIGSPQLALVEAEVRRQLLEHGRRLRDDVDERVAAQARRTTARATAASLRARRTALLETRARTRMDFANRFTTLDDRDEIYADIDAQVRVIDERLADLDATADAPAARATASLLMRVDARWDVMTAQEQRAALQLAGVREIRVRASRVKGSHVAALDMTDRVEVLFR